MNYKRIISTIEKWEILKNALKDKNYILWQMQYSYNDPNGFHARFYKVNSENEAEVITYNKEVQNAIVRYGSK